MYKQKRKPHLGMLLLVLLFIIAGIRMKIIKSEEAETFQEVKESEISNLISSENRKTNNKQKNNTKKIRVLIMTNGYRGEIHPEVEISSKSKMRLTMGKNREYIDSNEVLALSADDERFVNGKIRISSDDKLTIESLERSYGSPSYEGVIELRSTAEGIVIINELSVEKYLKAVVPSEMPASFELEALKVQAVCARSYAYRQMDAYAYPEYKVHVNDSTSYQVYGNVKPQKKSNQAIKDTKGQVVYHNNKIATTYYYSTSCGRTTDIRAWGTERTKENAYLKSVKVKGKKGDYEKNLPWYRWSAKVSAQELKNLIELNTGKEIGTLKKIEITKRGAGDIALEMKVTGEKQHIYVKTENKIRAAFGGGGYEIIRNDGSVIESRELLPSAFITIEKSGDTYVINGGGFGHGIGMSQNGANEMAKQGMKYKEILKRFYADIKIR